MATLYNLTAAFQRLSLQLPWRTGARKASVQLVQSRWAELQSIVFQKSLPWQQWSTGEKFK